MFFGSYGYSNPTFNGPSSPTRSSVWGSACSPFRNTNTPLEDITMGQTLVLTNGTNVKSPGKTSPAGGITGSSGPGVGRTMKDYEDQLKALKTDNFNLKLRIYFLEERMGITGVADQDAIKKNIELKVEIESLKKELLEKQELLSQAAKAIALFEEQKENSSRDESQYQKSLETERQKTAQLEKELDEYRQKMNDTSVYYKEAFGITPEKALENQEKIHQMEAFIASLEAEVKQLTASLEEERVWGLELESERDQLRDRLDNEIRSRENATAERSKEIEELRERIKDLEDQVFKRDNFVQQYRNELTEKDRIIREKNTVLEEKCRLYEEISLESDKRKKQIDQLRLSIKTRDDTITDINNKHRMLLSQFENGYMKRSPPNSPSALNSFGELNLADIGSNRSCIQSPSRCDNNSQVDWEPNRDRCFVSPTRTLPSELREAKELLRLVEEKDNELKRQEETRKQLVLKLCNAQKTTETSEHKLKNTEQRLKSLEVEYQKAIKSIQLFITQLEQMESKNLRKERRIMDLEIELAKLREQKVGPVYARSGGDMYDTAVSRESESEITKDNPERDHCNQQRFEEMEKKINDLRDQIDIIKAEKCRLEKQIQAESQELHEQLYDKEQKIESLENERYTIKKELKEKTVELDKLKQAYDQVSTNSTDKTLMNSNISIDLTDVEHLRRELNSRNTQIEEQNRKIDQLTKELQVKTQNLQKLVNTELWSKNKEIAKLHNHMTAASHCLDKTKNNKSDSISETNNNHLTILIKELNDIGIQVNFTDSEIIQLNYSRGDESIDIKTFADYVQQLLTQKHSLEKEVDYLKWLKFVSKPDINGDENNEEDNFLGNSTERTKKYCELLRTHLKELVKFMKDMLKNTGQEGDCGNDDVSNEHKKILLEVLVSSKILSDDVVQVLEKNKKDEESKLLDLSGKKSYSEALTLDLTRNHPSTQSDSEAFSEPDRAVSMARIGLQETQTKFSGRSRSKYTKQYHSDSEDSLDYVPYHKTYQNDLNDLDTNYQIQELKETNKLLYSELNALRNDLTHKISFDSKFDDKLTPILTKVEKSQKFCERLQSCLERRINEWNSLKKESKRNSIRKAQLEKKILDIENMAMEMTKQKTELFNYQENAERKNTEIIITLNRENDALRSRIQKLEEENEAAKASISTLTKELDHLTLSHSQILVENTKLTNDKLRLEQEIRKTENRYDNAVRSLHDKFDKEISDLNQINDSHRARVQELETTNKELRRHVAICEASDSAPSSSGVSSIPTEITLKQSCEDIPDYQPYNMSEYWLPVSYPVFGTRSKSSCSPDLGIESDAAVTTTRPLKDTLKITESMTNLLSDDDNGNSHRRTREADNESPLFIEGLDEKETLKQENEMLKKKLMKTRKALEETFQHLSASNKNKKNVEKAITKQLMITKGILKKTKTYEETFEN